MTIKAAILALTMGISLSGQHAAAHCCLNNSKPVKLVNSHILGPNAHATTRRLPSASTHLNPALYSMHTEGGVQVYRPNATIDAQHARNIAKFQSEQALREAQAHLAQEQARTAKLQNRLARAQTRSLEKNPTSNASYIRRNRSSYSSYSPVYTSLAAGRRFGSVYGGGFASPSGADIIAFNTGIGALSEGAFARRGAGLNDGLSVTQRVLNRQGALESRARAASTGGTLTSTRRASSASVAPKRAVSRGVGTTSGKPASRPKMSAPKH